MPAGSWGGKRQQYVCCTSAFGVRIFCDAMRRNSKTLAANQAALPT